MNPTALITTPQQEPLQLANSTPSTATRTPNRTAAQTAAQSAIQQIPDGTSPKEHIRHILLGSPEAIRQTIHLLHTLHYADTLLWTPIVTIEDPLIISPAQSEAISLLRKSI